MKIAVYLAGEGQSELGSRAAERAYQTDEQPGALVAIAEKRHPGRWEIRGAIMWSKLRQYVAGPSAAARRRAGIHPAADAPTRTLPPEARNVVALANLAADAKADALLFLRDEDGDQARGAQIHLGIDRARDRYPSMRIAAGLPRPALEAWILALQGERAVESLSCGKLEQRATEAFDADELKRAQAYADVVEAAELDAADAPSLLAWLKALDGVVAVPRSP